MGDTEITKIKGYSAHQAKLYNARVTGTSSSPHIAPNARHTPISPLKIYNLSYERNIQNNHPRCQEILTSRTVTPARLRASTLSANACEPVVCELHALDSHAALIDSYRLACHDSVALRALDHESGRPWLARCDRPRRHDGEPVSLRHGLQSTIFERTSEWREMC